MALDLRKNCNVCKAIQAQKDLGDDRLLKDIFSTTKYIPSSPKTLKHVFERWGYLGFSYLGLLRHAEKHQYMSQDDLDRNRLDKAVKKAQNDALVGVIKDVSHDKVRKRIMEKGMQELEEGRMKVTAKDLLNAANKQADIEDRQKDRTERLIKAIYAFASGAITPAAVGGNGAIGAGQEYIESDTR